MGGTQYRYPDWRAALALRWEDSAWFPGLGFLALGKGPTDTVLPLPPASRPRTFPYADTPKPKDLPSAFSPRLGCGECLHGGSRPTTLPPPPTSSVFLGKVGPPPLHECSASSPDPAHPRAFCSRGPAGRVSPCTCCAEILRGWWGAEAFRRLLWLIWPADSGVRPVALTSLTQPGTHGALSVAERTAL